MVQETTPTLDHGPPAKLGERPVFPVSGRRRDPSATVFGMESTEPRTPPLDPLPSVRYQPDNVLQDGYLSMFGSIYRELASNRWLTLQLFKRDLFALYKQSVVGLSWAVIIPAISVASFVLLRRSGLLTFGELQVPYPLFAILGLAYWQLFATGVIAGADSLVRAGPMIVKINFSRKSLVLASAGQALVSFAIQIVLVLALLLAYGQPARPALLLIPFLAIPMLLLTLGLGFVLAIVNGIFRDVGNVLPVVLTFGMFLTPVLYPRTTAGLLGTLTTFNPLSYLVDVPRDIVLTGGSVDIGGFVLSSAISALVFVCSILLFHITEKRIAERI
jgi:lipopolysaccharide transport system permease protein